MIDAGKIRKLYQILNNEKKREFREVVFGKCQSSVNYFDNHADGITFAKMELVADFFGVSLDFLRDASRDQEVHKEDVVKHLQVKDLQKNEVNVCKDKIKIMQQTIDALNDSVLTKNRIIEMMEHQIKQLSGKAKN